MSIEAKVLYGLMLDRMSLPAKNGWFDDENRVYIIYTVQDIMEELCCGRQKAAKLLEELENSIGLIEHKRRGLGKPNIIYVKNFVYKPHEKIYEKPAVNNDPPEVLNPNFQKFQNQIQLIIILIILT